MMTLKALDGQPYSEGLLDTVQRASVPAFKLLTQSHRFVLSTMQLTKEGVVTCKVVMSAFILCSVPPLHVPVSRPPPSLSIAAPPLRRAHHHRSSPEWCCMPTVAAPDPLACEPLPEVARRSRIECRCHHNREASCRRWRCQGSG